MRQDSIRLFLELLIFSFLIIACSKEDSPQKKSTYLNVSDGTNVIDSVPGYYFDRRILLDTTLIIKKLDFVQIRSFDKIDTLISFCNCEKNFENNSLKIQIGTSFPPASKLKQSGLRLVLPPPQITEKGFDIQYGIITFSIKDSIVQNAYLMRISTEKEFQGKNKELLELSKFKLTINKFRYNIASDIWGEYTVIIPSGFTRSKSDSLISGTFHCNNNGIIKLEQLETYIDQTPTRGFVIE